MLEDLSLEFAQRGRGLDAEVVRQRMPRLLIGTESLRLPARSVQRQHVLPSEALAKWIAGNQGLQLADKIAVTPEQEIGFEPALHRRDAKLLEPRLLRRRKRLRRELRERRPSPQLKRGAESHSRLFGPSSVEVCPSGRDKPLEAVKIDVV